MEPRPPRSNRPAPSPPPDAPQPAPPETPPPTSPEGVPHAPPPPPRSTSRWDEPAGASYPASPTRPVDPAYRPRPDPYATSAGAASPGGYGSAGAPPPAARPPWYDPAGPGTPGMGVQPPASPPPGVRAGSAGGAGWFLRALVAALAVGILLIAAAFAYTRARDDDDDGNDQAVAEATSVRATELAELAAVRSTPAGTPALTPTAEPTATATVAASPTATEDEEDGDAAAAGEETDDEDQESAEEDGSAPTQRSRLPFDDLFPTEDEAPAGFVIDAESDGRFSFEEVATSPGMPADAAARLEEWDWREGRFRGFEPPAGAAPAPEETNYLYVSVHRFGSADGATEALDFFGDIKAEAGLDAIEVEPIGDEMRALSNAAAGGTTEVDLYIRDGSRVIRIAAFSEAGDPLADAIAFAAQVLGIS